MILNFNTQGYWKFSCEPLQEEHFLSTSDNFGSLLKVKLSVYSLTKHFFQLFPITFFMWFSPKPIIPYSFGIYLPTKCFKCKLPPPAFFLHFKILKCVDPVNLFQRI
uniref:Uncharacterized protein n=1 Tax=Cacopsylla melanoneura TaxID=428564 RepID=A0A8D8RS49_9HEMI